MRIAMITLLVIFVWIAMAGVVSSWQGQPGDPKGYLKQVTKYTDKILDKIRKRWDVDNFPDFLSTVSMQKSGWEVLRTKLEMKLLMAMKRMYFGTLYDPEVSFVISFMGTSVSAGHDSSYNRSFPMLTEDIYADLSRYSQILFKSRPAAVGNNPCMPYDLCPATYAGMDADMIVLEQTFNCFFDDSNGNRLHEMFVRLAMRMPNQPVIAFSDSLSPNWDEKDCNDKPTEPPPIEEPSRKRLEALKNNHRRNISTELNNVGWEDIKGLQHAYKGAGIQMWVPGFYGDKYKCRGPFSKIWGCCSSSWHPSLLGHELRADNHAFHLMLTFKDAIESLTIQLNNGESFDSIFTKTKNYMHKEHKHVLGKPKHETSFSDSFKCYTAWLPVWNEDRKLQRLILPSKNDKRPPFQYNGFDTVMHYFKDGFSDIDHHNRVMGYTDFKGMYFGNNQNAPISLKADVEAEGYIYICESSAWWGAMPDQFKRIHKLPAKIYLTYNVPRNYDGFDFDVNTAKEIEYFHAKPYGYAEPTDEASTMDGQMLCCMTKEKVPRGKHVLTMASPSTDYLFFSTVIIP